LLHTTADLLRLTAEKFFDEVLRKRLQVRAVVEGYNFRFGRDRRGDTDLLSNLCRGAGVEFTTVPPFKIAGQPVSSSRVRSALEEGDVRTAADLLQRPYRLRGIVGRG